MSSEFLVGEEQISSNKNVRLTTNVQLMKELNAHWPEEPGWIRQPKNTEVPAVTGFLNGFIICFYVIVRKTERNREASTPAIMVSESQPGWKPNCARKSMASCIQVASLPWFLEWKDQLGNCTIFWNTFCSHGRKWDLWFA